MPEITVSMAAGRTDEQKVGMMRDITQALVKNLGVDPEAVVIQINEAPLVHKMKGGVSFVERFAKKGRARVIPDQPGAELGISRHNIEIPDRPACLGPSG